MKAGKSSKKAEISFQRTYGKLEERKSDNFLPKTSTFSFFSSYTGHDLRGLTHHNAAIKHVPFFFTGSVDQRLVKT